jgi:hypothetical protein
MPEGTNETRDWKSGLPEDLKTAPALKDMADVATLAKAFVETKAFVGSSLRPPGPDATPEMKMDFIAKLREKVPELLFMPDGEDEPAKVARETAWTKLGRPKEAKDYALPVDLTLPDEHLEALRQEAFNEGLTKSQFQTRAKRIADAISTAELNQKTSTANLKKELGAAFDERTASVASVAAKLGFSPELVSALKSGTIDQQTFKAFAAIAKGFGETRQVANQEGGGSGRLTPAEIDYRIAELQSNPAFFNPKAAEMNTHRLLVQKFQELQSMKFPD